MRAVLLGVWPRALDHMAAQLGIRYSPALLLVCAVCVLFIKALHADMVNTRIERKVRRLSQSIALMQLKAMSDAQNAKATQSAMPNVFSQAASDD